MITETIYKNRDNVISIELRADGAAQNIASSTKITIEVGGITLSSATATSGAFDYTTYGSTGRLDLKLGNEADIKTMKSGQYRARITVYDATYTNGRVWDDMIIEVE
jgi:hypothetical protein